MQITVVEEHTRNLTKKELRDATREYLKEHVLEGMTINDKGDLETWEYYGHGSGLTQTWGPPTKLQVLASDLLKGLSKENE